MFSERICSIVYNHIPLVAGRAVFFFSPPLYFSELMTSLPNGDSHLKVLVDAAVGKYSFFVC